MRAVNVFLRHDWKGMIVCRQKLEFPRFLSLGSKLWPKGLWVVCPYCKRQWGHSERFVQVFLARLVSREAILFLSWFKPSVLFLNVWGLVDREVCYCLNPRVRFSGDFIGESGDEAYLSPISARISAIISTSLLPLAMFARPVSEFVVHSFGSCVL